MICKVFGLILFLTGALSLDPTGFCNSDLDCEGGFECAGRPWKPPVPFIKPRYEPAPNRLLRKCRPRLTPKGVFCSPKCQFPSRCLCAPNPYLRHRDRAIPHVGVCANLDPTGKYCIQENHCADDHKCAASGQEEYGICRPDLDPTGKYCLSTRDCKWYLFETCSDQGECVKKY